VCRKIGVSQATFYAWKKKYAGVGVSEFRRLRQPEDENKKLMMLQEVLKKSSAAG
jgi:putative transposase